MSSIARIQATVDRLNEESNGSIQRYGYEFDEARIESFLRHRSVDETIADLTRLAEWQIGVNQQNHDGVTLTPVLMDFLAEPGNIEEKLAELDRLQKNTRMGHFDPCNEIERDLEFHRYNWAYHDVIEPDFDPNAAAPYEQFLKQPVLDPQTHDEFVLDGQNLVDARRVAYEAYTLLGFLRKFRAGTSRPIIIIGNDRYGRQWGIEPLEEYLRDDFSIVYPRVPSHRSTRLTVPHMILNTGARAGLDRGSIRYLSTEMPHVIVVDARNVGHGKHRLMMRMSRGARDHANWFIAFNDLRAEGDGSKYEHKMPYAPNHYPELKKWFGFVEVQRKIRPWVEPGETYSMTMWAPEITDETVLGDFRVRTRQVEYDSDEPQVVLANPLFYRTDEDDPDIHENLRGNRPYYFDGPERHVRHEVRVGFGDFGVESRVTGNTSDELVEAVQEFMRQEVARLLSEESGDGD